MKEQSCKYRLPCGWCDKYDRRCEHIESLIAKKDFERMAEEIKEIENEHKCEHEWLRYIINIDEKEQSQYVAPKYIAHICSKCGDLAIGELKREFY